jgi:hypothetical protein
LLHLELRMQHKREHFYVSTPIMFNILVTLAYVISVLSH